MARVYVSIGTNIDRARNVRSCVVALRRHYGRLILSPVYETAAVGFQGEDFYNLVAGFDTEEDVHAVVRVLDEIERAHGRTRTGPRFSSRTLDVDLLLYDDLVLHEEGLSIPRDEITRYAFVLRPLAEVAGEGRHPVSGRRFDALWEEYDASEQPMRRVEGVL
jgi:2-amino-4-hydroxy-6-hydroxymethyldihydropteridine diphosphokinase